MGLLVRAAPQMNLLSEGFPFYIITTFAVLALLFPSLCNAFLSTFERAFATFEAFMAAPGGVP
jgi:flagellar biosynthetic protein FliR